MNKLIQSLVFLILISVGCSKSKSGISIDECDTQPILVEILDKDNQGIEWPDNINLQLPNIIISDSDNTLFHIYISNTDWQSELNLELLSYHMIIEPNDSDQRIEFKEANVINESTNNILFLLWDSKIDGSIYEGDFHFDCLLTFDKYKLRCFGEMTTISCENYRLAQQEDGFNSADCRFSPAYYNNGFSDYNFPCY